MLHKHYLKYVYRKNLASCNGPAVRIKGNKIKGKYETNKTKQSNKTKRKKNIYEQKHLRRESNLDHLLRRLAPRPHCVNYAVMDNVKWEMYYI